MTTTTPTTGPAEIIPADGLRIAGGRTLRFEGADHGATLSFFLVDSDPGQGPGLHWHPYDETWTVIEGEATVVIGEVTLVAHPGDTAVAPAEVWHRFTNTGTGRLRMLCLHASPVMIQTFADPA